MKEMIVNGLIKALMPANHKAFVEMINLKDQKERLAFIKLEEDQKNVILLCRAK